MQQVYGSLWKTKKVTELDLSVVVPVFNEAAGISQFLSPLRVTLDSMQLNYEVIVVDDGSVDQTVKEVLSSRWPEVRLVILNKNVGHQVALDAGIDSSRGRWIITMDGDGQHPPEALPLMYQTAISEDADVVFAVSQSRLRTSPTKNLFALAYYRMIRFLTGANIRDSQADFRLTSRRVADDVRNVKGDRVMRLLLPTIGYTSSVIPYEMQKRLAGEGRFGVGNQLSLAWSSVLGFSAKPLRFLAGLALVVTSAALAWIIYVLWAFISGSALPGWTSVIAAVLALGSFLLLGQAMLASYVAALFDMVKGKPRYTVRRTISLRDE